MLGPGLKRRPMIPIVVWRPRQRQRQLDAELARMISHADTAGRRCIAREFAYRCRESGFQRNDGERTSIDVGCILRVTDRILLSLCPTLFSPRQRLESADSCGLEGAFASAILYHQAQLYGARGGLPHWRRPSASESSPGTAILLSERFCDMRIVVI